MIVTDKRLDGAPETTPLAQLIMLIVHLQEAATLASPRGKKHTIARTCILADGAAELLQTAANHGESWPIVRREITSVNPSPQVITILRADCHTRLTLVP